MSPNFLIPKNKYVINNLGLWDSKTQRISFKHPNIRSVEAVYRRSLLHTELVEVGESLYSYARYLESNKMILIKSKRIVRLYVFEIPITSYKYCSYMRLTESQVKNMVFEFQNELEVSNLDSLYTIV